MKRSARNAICPVCQSQDTFLTARFSSRQAALHLAGSQDDARTGSIERQVQGLWHGSTASFFRCSDCTLSFAVPFVAGDASLYSEAYRGGQYEEWKWEFEAALPLARATLASVPAPSLLEAGAGRGAFLKRLLLDAVPPPTILATELSESGRSLLADLGVECCPTDFRDEGFARGRTFDVICLFQVLEHLDRPPETFRKLAQLARPEALLLISVPNWRQRAVWDACGVPMDVPPAHITRWTGRAMRAAAEPWGWTLVSEQTEPQSARSRFRDVVLARYFRTCPAAPMVRRLSARSLRRALAMAALAAWMIPAMPHLPKLLAPDTGTARLFVLRFSEGRK